MRSTGGVGKLASGVTTGVLLACALTVTGLALRREIVDGPAVSQPPIELMSDWRDYVAGGHRIGPDSARVVIVEFADFQCPACRTLELELRDLLAKFGDSLAIQYRHLPLARIHPFARPAAIASECAARQGRFEAMHHSLFDRQDSLGVLSWRTIAARSGVSNLVSFERCLQDSTVGFAVDRDADAGRRAGARGTPTLLINNKRLRGVPPRGTLDSLIREAMRDGKTP